MAVLCGVALGSSKKNVVLRLVVPLGEDDDAIVNFRKGFSSLNDIANDAPAPRCLAVT